MEGRFGQYLRGKRMAKNYSMRALAVMVDCTPAYICDIELSRRKPPSPEKLEKISQALELDIDELKRLARADRRKIEISLESKPEKIRHMAFSLARAFDEGEMTEELAGEIESMLNKKREGRAG